MSLNFAVVFPLSLCDFKFKFLSIYRCNWFLFLCYILFSLLFSLIYLLVFCLLLSHNPPTMAPTFDPLSKVYPQRETWRFKVRVIRLWTVPGFNNPNHPTSVEMVLMDEFGGKIQASVRKTLVYKFLPLLVEGKVYKMSYFSVTPNIGSYRATTHDHRLVFTYKTNVDPCESEVIPMYGLSLVPFNDIFKHRDDSDFLVDVIGLLTGVSNEREYVRDGKLTKMVVIELTDYEGKLECALFGDYVDELNAFMSSGNLDQPIVVLQFAKIKMFRGNIVIQNVLHASRILFNPNISEALEFKNGLAVHGVDGSQSMGLLTDGPRISIEDDFMKLFPKKSINQLSVVNEDGIFVVMATITGILDEGGWWYASCKCHKAVTPDSGMYYCDNCYCHVLNVMPRYRIKLDVFDDSGSAVFVLFDRDGQHLLKKPCIELVSEVQKAGDVLSFPDEVLQLVGKTLLFKVEKKSDSSSNFDGSYKVKRTCDDETVISMFKLEDADVSPPKAFLKPAFNEVCNLDSDVEELESVKTKAFLSQVIVSPVSLGSAKLSVDTSSPPLKRKLDVDFEASVEVGSSIVLKKVKIEKE